MKPIGTITNCFPHVDEETKSVLQIVMEEAENYADFVGQICNKVCSETSSPLLQYLAFYAAFELMDINLTDMMEAAGKVPVLAEPLMLLTRFYRNMPFSLDDLNKSLKKALKVAPNDWIASHLYLQC